MQYVNLTPHMVRVRRKDGSYVEYPPDGTTARVEMMELTRSELDGVSCIERREIRVHIQPKQPGLILIVSSMVLNALGPDRIDVVAPDTGVTAERDKNGQVVACTQWVRVPRKKT